MYVCMYMYVHVYMYVYRYQHSRQLIQALNSFVDHDTEMPEGWEKKLNKEGKVSHMT